MRHKYIQAWKRTLLPIVRQKTQSFPVSSCISDSVLLTNVDSLPFVPIFIAILVFTRCRIDLVIFFCHDMNLLRSYFCFRFINARRRIVQPMIDQSNRAGKRFCPRKSARNVKIGNRLSSHPEPPV